MRNSSFNAELLINFSDTPISQLRRIDRGQTETEEVSKANPVNQGFKIKKKTYRDSQIGQVTHQPSGHGAMIPISQQIPQEIREPEPVSYSNYNIFTGSFSFERLDGVQKSFDEVSLFVS
jgi:hypothetical protein